MRVWLFIASLLISSFAMALEVDSKIGLSTLLFKESPPARYDPDKKQHNQQASILLDFEFYQSWNDDQDSLFFKPYARIDQYDEQRTHFDIRELVWLHVADTWELRTGISKVFWGVNEANQLVDIINQDDQVDDISGDPKLGQPMVNLSLIKDWGIIDVFLLPGFRERTFPGKEGRLRGPFFIDTDNAQYESSAKNKHVDFALRWNHTIDDYDIGLYYFRGTSRDPRFIAGKYNNGLATLIPYYEQIDQLALDFQATREDWLWKFEAFQRRDQFDNFAALSGGFEYTFVGIFESSSDIGFIMEYSWDERDDNILNRFQNDLMIGSRFTLNDAQSSELLAGFVQDLDYGGLYSFQIEASRRLGDDWTLSMELRLFSSHKLSFLQYDDHLQLTLEHYF